MNQVLCFISSTVKIIYLITLNIYIALVLSWKRIRLQCRGPWFDSWVGKICWRRDKPPTPVFLGFPYGLAGKESACSAGDLGSIPGIGLGRLTGERKGYPLQYSGLENSMDSIVHGVAKSQTWLSDFHFHFSHMMFSVQLSNWGLKEIHWGEERGVGRTSTRRTGYYFW